MNVKINYSIAEIASVCKGKWLQGQPGHSLLSYLSLDSRKILFPADTVFFAINNRHRHASFFIESLYEKGCRNFVTDDEGISVKHLREANILLVKDTLSALQSLAAHHRRHFSKKALPVTGITGSNGKTIVKEWLSHLLEETYDIARSPKSYNSQIGVPLSVLNIAETTTLAIFEAGISLPGEMKTLQKIIQPTTGIFTNIGHAHDEGFKSTQQKIREKLVLFKQADHLIFCADDKNLAAEIKLFKQYHKDLQLFSWGRYHRDTLQVKEVTDEAGGCRIRAVHKKRSYTIHLPFKDEAAVQNAVHCLCFLLLAGRQGRTWLRRFESLPPVAMRLEIKEGINNCHIINDSYSNDLHSLDMALHMLSQQKQHPSRSVILSDILQSGRDPRQLYAEVAMLLKQNGTDYFYGIGTAISAHSRQFSGLPHTAFYESTGEFIDKMLLSAFRDQSILIKGARRFEFEKISQALEKQMHQTVLSINLNNLIYNLKKYREKIKPSTRVMAMVKAFGYGSGSHEIASVLEFNKADYLAVAYTDEGTELRKAGITLPIMVMNTDQDSFDALVHYQLEPEIFSFGLLDDFTRYIKNNRTEPYPVHLKMDTGMHRLGFMPHETSRLCKQIASNQHLSVKSVFSHLAASDDPAEDAFTEEQFHTFRKMCSKIEKALGYSFLKHIDNTSGTSRHPAFQMDMVRLGIGLYGIDSSPAMQSQLKNVSTLTTTISQLKKIKAGETVGYNRKGKVMKDSLIATVRIGYADGYTRRFGNGTGSMLVKNRLAPVIGNVCMDMTMLDVTGIKDVKEGDEVVVFGEALPPALLAQWAQTIPYEIMTGISHRVKRIYFEE